MGAGLLAGVLPNPKPGQACETYVNFGPFSTFILGGLIQNFLPGLSKLLVWEAWGFLAVSIYIYIYIYTVYI